MEPIPPSPPPVRFYPERVAGRARPVPLSPSQAVHLPRSPERLAAAIRTGEVVELTPDEPDTLASPPLAPSAPAPARARRPRWWRLGRRPRQRAGAECRHCGNRLEADGRCPLGHRSR